MKIYFQLLISTLVLSSCLTKRDTLINMSHQITDKVNQAEFEECILNNDFQILLNPKRNYHTINFFYYPLKKLSDSSCEGMYLYDTRSSNFRSPKLSSGGYLARDLVVFLIKDGEIVNVWHLGEEGRTEYRNSNIEWFRSLNVEPDSEMDSIYVKGFMNFTS